MLLVTDAEKAENDLAAARLTCRCGGRLRSWGHAAPRSIRTLDATVVRLRPRRVRCARCLVTHVLLPGWCLPRHGESAETVGAALVAKAAGQGWRTIARAPPGWAGLAPPCAAGSAGHAAAMPPGFTAKVSSKLLRGTPICSTTSSRLAACSPTRSPRWQRL